MPMFGPRASQILGDRSRESHQEFWRNGRPMKKWSVTSIALLLLLSATAIGQEASQKQTASRKTISVTGKMSEDGRVLLRDADNQVWTVSNPEALQDYAGQEVVIRCQLVPDKKELRVVSVKQVKGETPYATKWGDSAFRR
jgi:hypothetical protein